MSAAGKHSPGPWLVEHEEPTGVVIHSEVHGHIATAPYTGDTTITRANARLIAVAPELLDALRDAARSCPCNARERDSGHLVDCYAPSAFEVIAKAEGRES